MQTKKDVFRYLMEDVNESSSENNIVVDGIKDFAGSPQQINKKAYVMAFTADEDRIPLTTWVQHVQAAHE